MKKVILILLALLLVPVASQAAAPVLGPYAVTTNTDVDLVPEAISSLSSMASCQTVTICNVTTGASATIVKVQQLETAPVASATGGGVYLGWPLYPLASSGETCVTFNAAKNLVTGKVTPINATKIYAITTNSIGNSSIAMNCTK